MSDEAAKTKHRKALAKALAKQANSIGMVTVIRDSEGRAICLPGHDFQTVGVYEAGAKYADIADDLEFCEVDR